MLACSPCHGGTAHGLPLFGRLLDIGFAITVVTARPASLRCRHHSRHHSASSACQLVCQRPLAIAAAGLPSQPSPPGRGGGARGWQGQQVNAAEIRRDGGSGRVGICLSAIVGNHGHSCNVDSCWPTCRNPSSSHKETVLTAAGPSKAGHIQANEHKDREIEGVNTDCHACGPGEKERRGRGGESAWRLQQLGCAA